MLLVDVEGGAERDQRHEPEEMLQAAIDACQAASLLALQLGELVGGHCVVQSVRNCPKTARVEQDVETGGLAGVTGES